MSADEFDAEIERLFSRTPHMADAEIFASGVEAKLASGSRFRSLALTTAGLVGGIFAVREAMSVNLTLSSGSHSGEVVGRGLVSASGSATDVVRTFIDSMEIANIGFGSTGGMQLFWITAAALVAVAAVGFVKLSQEI